MTTNDPTARTARTAAQLRAAASIIRQLSTHATTGPWYPDGTDGVYAYGDPGDCCPTVFRDRSASYADIRWVATLNPTIAGPLAALLDDAAAAADDGDHPGYYQHAKDIAEMVNADWPDGVDR
jgi:hypothetical protein